MTDTNNFQGGRVEDSGPNCPASPQPSPEAGVAPSGGRNRGVTWLGEHPEAVAAIERGYQRALQQRFTDDDGNDIGTMPNSHAWATMVHIRNELAALSAAPVEYQWGVLIDGSYLPFEPGPHSESFARDAQKLHGGDLSRRTVGPWEVVDD